MLPNLIIIGAMKCGTTSLHYYLDLHPEISMSAEKELNFFLLEKNWVKGRKWYESQFDERAKLRGESSPGYTCYPLYQGVPERMHSLVSDVALIYVVRDPIERIVSHYIHNCASGLESRPFAEALAEINSNLYVECSRYFMQSDQYLKFFAKSQLLVIAQEDLYHRRDETMRKVFRFLGVKESFHSARFLRIKHPTTIKRRMTPMGRLLSSSSAMRLLEWLPPDVRGYNIRQAARRVILFPFSRKIDHPVVSRKLKRALIESLGDDVDRLRALTGNPFSGWSL